MSTNVKKIIVDSFSLSGTQITAFAIVGGKNKEFYMTREEFEAWADENDMREWAYSRAGANDAADEDMNGEFAWHEIYDGHEIMCDFLRQYIRHLYIQELFDIETPLKQILHSHKSIAI